MDVSTIETYDRGAMHYAHKFAGIGPRTTDIERGFSYCGKENLRVLELGCGDGRDAVEICRRTTDYTGVDASKELITIAKDRNIPRAVFEIADIEMYTFPESLDLIFAFASLLHVPRNGVSEVLECAYESLSKDGIFYISVKEGLYSASERVADEHGERLFYYYTEEDLLQLSNNYTVVYTQHQVIKGAPWLLFVVQK